MQRYNKRLALKRKVMKKLNKTKTMLKEKKLKYKGRYGQNTI